MSISAPRNRGSVLWIALVAVIVAMSVALSVLQTSMSNSKAQDKFGAQTNAFFATHGSVELVMSDYFGRYNGQTGSNIIGNFDTWLTTDLSGAQAFLTLPVNSADKVGEDFRAGPASYTPAASASGSPTKDTTTIVTRAIVSKFNGNIDGDRMITTVRLYRKLRPQPGNYIVDLLVVVETQKNIGASVSQQVSAMSSLTIGDQNEMLQPHWESQLYTFQSPPTFNGFDYALLTKNVSCTMCHFQTRNRARIDNLNAYTYYNSLGTTGATQAAVLKSKFGTFERTKVGITENLTLRSNAMYSQIEGSLYQRGVIQYEGSGNPLTPSQFVGDTAWSVGFNPGSTTIAQDLTTGAISKTPFANQLTDLTVTPNVLPAPNGSCYMNYGTSSNAMTDGGLPSSNFPSPFPERSTTTNVVNSSGTTVQTIVGADNRIDAGEISDASQDLKKASDPTVASRLTGGLALKLPAGTIYQGTTLPSSATAVTTNVGGSIDYLSSVVTGGTAGTATPGSANITASDTGNYILTGTAANPLVIDGKVMIDGDVVLRGYVKGTGQLFVTGNVYIPGDVIYANANAGTIQESFGTASDGTSNLLGVIAGKNIVVGDFLSQITTWNSGDTNQLTPLELQTTVSAGGSKTYTLNAKPGSTEPGKKLTYTPAPNTAGTYKTYVGPTQVDGYTMPSISLPSGTTMPTAVSNTVSVSSTQTFVGTNEPNFIMQQLTLFNRNELMKTMQYLPTANPTQSTSYTSAGGGILNNATNAPAATVYDANYIPRFYSFYPYDGTNATTQQTNPALALIYSGSTYNSTNKTWNGATDPHGFDYFTSVDSMPANSISNAARFAKSVINVAPSWITPANMLRITTSEQAARTSVIADAELNPTSPYLVPDRRIDGIMYTKNAVLCIERSKALSFNTSTNTWTRVSTVSGGRVQVNGAMIAPDTGLLICDGPEHPSWPSRQNFIINYDARVRNLLKIANQDFSSFTSWGVTRITMVRNTGSLPPAP